MDRDTHLYYLLIREMDEEAEDLTEWEKKFISDLIDKDAKRFTQTQRTIIDEINMERL